MNTLMTRRLTATDRFALAALRLYRARLTRYTKPCSQEPSCSAYAVVRVAQAGWRTGLADTADRMVVCRCDRPGE